MTQERQLKKGMYGEEHRQTGALFGLRCGQHRSVEKLTHGSGWYNKAGEKLGWGDLSARDFERISRDIHENELFFVLSEQASYRDFITMKGVVDPDTGAELKMEAPGYKYVAEHAIYIIAKDRLTKINHSGEKKTRIKRYGLVFEVIDKRDL